MNASYDWLKAFVPFDLTPAELRDLLTSRVATVDDLVALRADLAPIVVARVAEAKRHPNSEHLWVTKVDAGGGELLDVVCGASNVQAGKLYPFAATGTTMPNGLKIERRKIRGETSNGMLCSARELGLGEDHDGIMELDVVAVPGTPFLTAVPVGDTRLVVDVLPNRPDLLSHVGLAREIAATTGLPLRLPEIPAGDGGVAPLSARTVARIEVEVEDSEGAPRYAGQLVRGVGVGPSPAWLVARVEAVGGRSINNVVDATNYVMHELGQPLHAFDAAKLGGGRIVVRRARPRETITTLDGVTRTLDSEMTVIADGDRAQAVAGVMGGATSEVGPETTDIFLESARFDPRRTRATRRRLGLSTDASYRFERGVDAELATFALERLTQVVLAVAGGERAGGVVDVRAQPSAPATLRLRPSRVARLLGVPVPPEEIAQLLGPVGFGVAAGDGDALSVAIPSWRSDVRGEADLAEEVARLRGYDRIPDELRPYRPGRIADAPLSVAADRVRAAMVAAGLYETRAMPFVAGADETHVRVRNPLAESEAHLRRSVLETLAGRAEYNLARMRRVIRLFEVGAVFAPDAAGALPTEEFRAAALVLGPSRPLHFTDEGREPADVDEWDAKALAERLAGAAYPSAAVELRPVSGGEPLWHVVADGETLGEVRRLSLDAPVWAAPAFGVELTLGRMEAGAVAPPGENAYVEPAGGIEAPRGARLPRYQPIPSTPAVLRDLTLLLPAAVAAADVERVMRASGGDILERIEVRADYRGPGLPAGTRAVTWQLTFRHPDRTLRDKEVEARREKLLRTLESELGVVLRV